MKLKYKKKRLAAIIAGVAVLAIFFAGVVYNVGTEYSHYRYDVNKDYIYDLKKTSSIVSELELKDCTVTLADSYNNCTALLKIRISPRLSSMVTRPYIEIKTGKKSLKEYFEHNARGIRYINISDLNLCKGDKLKLVGHHLEIADQKVQVAAYANEDISNKKILIISPHPDDAEIAAYGLYSTNSENTYIVTISAGDAGGYKYNEIYDDKKEHYTQKGKLRTWNSITVPLLGGVTPERCINLCYFDGTFTKMFENKGKAISGVHTDIANLELYRSINVSSMMDKVKGDSSWNGLVANLKAIIGKIGPDIIITPHPAIDSHPDHKLSTAATLEALESLGDYDVQLYLYSNHFHLCEYYPYGPSNTMITLPPQFDDSLYFDKILSYPVSLKTQKAKIFALEAMNDLRIDTEWQTVSGTTKLAIKSYKTAFMESMSYYRRAIRQNELFYVVDMSKLKGKNVYSILGLKEVINKQAKIEY